MPHSLTSPTSWVNQWLLELRVSSLFTLKTLIGDGSQRTFYRIELEKPQSPLSEKNYVLISEPEWILSRDYAPHQVFLESLQLPVPRFLKVDSKQGFLAMEDLGDEWMQTRILSHPTQKMMWLKLAISHLAELHGKTFPVPKELPVSSRRFDKEKFSQELLYTWENLGEGSLAAERHEPLIRFCEGIASINPWVFSHRDYHTRNLMIRHEKVVFIDFQDARLGPPHYDLASLIYDAYIPLTKDEREILLQLYQSELKKYDLFVKIDWNHFRKDLGKIAWQRMVKAAGSFASFYKRHQKKTHLPFLFPALTAAIDLAKADPEIPRIFPLEQWRDKKW